MKRIRFISLSLLVALAMHAPSAFSCEWAEEYFHQITALRGNVVGVSKGDLRHGVRSLRQQVVRANLKLSLFEYRSPLKSRSEMLLLTSRTTDENGTFDFGPLKAGHYTLIIATPWGGEDRYDVQISELPTNTDSVTIDISPVYPDCKGGHEFVVHTPK